MNIESWLSIAAVIVSFISLVISCSISIVSWHRSRAIYGLEEFVLRRFNGSRDDATSRGLKAINDKLKTGKYIVQGLQDRADGDWAVILAQVKK